MPPMGLPRSNPPVLHFVAAFSQFDEALDWAREWTERNLGTIALTSRRYSFDETAYYTSTMGTGLKKQFFALADLAVADRLAARKLETNAAEAQLAATRRYDVARPINLDPGYLTESKLVLASTKDHAHRIYLGQGIFAEITLRYQRPGWQAWEWTYPDYRRADYHQFFDSCRQYYRQALQRALRG